MLTLPIVAGENNFQMRVGSLKMMIVIRDVVLQGIDACGCASL
jgi:hypothetical protein